MGTEPDAAKSFLPMEIYGGDAGHVWSGPEYDYQTMIDFTSGIFVVNTGWNNPAIWQRIKLAHTLHAYNYPTVIRKRYVDALCAKTGFECVALFCEGAVAVEAALRVMRKQSQKPTIWFTPGRYMHGKTLGTKYRQNLCLQWFGRRLAKHLGENVVPRLYSNTAGIILESYRGWDAHFWDKQWIQDLRAYCTEHDILLCFDEIQSGFGRTGKFFCYEHYDVKPDLVVFGKAAGGGLPLSGVLGPKALLDLPGDLSATHSGWPMGCAAGLAVLEEMERLNLVEEAERKGKILWHRLADDFHIISRYILKGRGMVAAILTDTVEEANHIVTECYNRGLLVVHTGRQSVKIGPPLTISDEALNKGLDILEGVLNG